MLAACLSSLLLGSFMCGLVVVCRRFGLDPGAFQVSPRYGISELMQHLQITLRHQSRLVLAISSHYFFSALSPLRLLTT
jgi:hypothetical protein